MNENDVVKISKADYNKLWDIMEKLESPKVTYNSDISSMKGEVITQSKELAENMHDILREYMED